MNFIKYLISIIFLMVSAAAFKSPYTDEIFMASVGLLSVAYMVVPPYEAWKDEEKR